MVQDELDGERVRDLLLAVRVDPGVQVSLDAITRGGMRLRRKSRAGAAVAAVVAAGVLGGAGVLAQSLSGPAATVPTLASTAPGPAGPSATTSVTPTNRAAPPLSRVIVVAASQPVKVSTTKYLWLTLTHECLGPLRDIAAAPGSDAYIGDCRSAVDGNQPQGGLGMQDQASGGAAAEGALVSGIYQGTDAASIIIRDAATQTTKAATIVQLASKPGWVTFYAVFPWVAESDPPAPAQTNGPVPPPRFTSVAYDAVGNQVNKF